MNLVLNYIGQLRLYSLVDLVFFLVAAGADSREFIGILFLWVGFLAFLESAHKHGYRANVPRWVPYLLYLVGFILFPTAEAVAFIVLGYFYAKKKEGGFAAVSPLVRGLQSLVLIGGVVGYGSVLPIIAGIATGIRNFLGDVRDVKKDKEEGMNTIPVLMKIKNGMPYIHLYAVMATSTIAWYFSGIPVFYLFVVFAIQVATYDITPR